MFNKKQKYEINRVSLKNSNLGTNSIRSHAYSAKSIDNTVSYLDDSNNIVSTVSGKYKSHKKIKIEKDNESPLINVTSITNRYAGLSTGRISERGDWVNLIDYIKWIKEIKGVITSSAYKPKDTFKRYSQRKKNIKKPQPRNILLDIEDIKEEFKVTETITENGETLKKGEPIEFTNICSEINETKNPKGKSEFDFEVIIQDKIKRKILITYNSESNKYELQSEDIDELFESDENSNYKSIIQYLNKTQSFRIFTEEKNCIYAYGSFYSGLDVFGKSFDPSKYNLLKAIFGIDVLSKLKSEKGKTTPTKNGNNWEKDSIFSQPLKAHN